MIMFNQFRRGHYDRMASFEGFGFGPQAEMFRNQRNAMGRDRFFKKGNLQFVILQMLEKQPRHGYQIIKDLEEQFRGFYSPSPGSVYPILQMLEDRDFVSIAKEGNKKVYTITEEGQKFLEENQDDEFLQRMKQFENMDFEAMKASREQLQEVFKLFMQAGHKALQNEENKDEFEAFIAKTKEELQQFLKDKEA